jgi:hypothetical protein
MIHRALLLCVAVIAALSSRVAAFSNAPATGSTVGLLKGASSSCSRAFPGSRTTLYAGKKGTTTKKASTKKSAKKTITPVADAESDDGVVKFKKADFVSAVAAKTGMTKVQSELALTAVLDVLATVSKVSFLHSVFIGEASFSLQLSRS